MSAVAIPVIVIICIAIFASNDKTKNNNFSLKNEQEHAYLSKLPHKKLEYVKDKQLNGYHNKEETQLINKYKFSTKESKKNG